MNNSYYPLGQLPVASNRDAKATDPSNCPLQATETCAKEEVEDASDEMRASAWRTLNADTTGVVDAQESGEATEDGDGARSSTPAPTSTPTTAHVMCTLRTLELPFAHVDVKRGEGIQSLIVNVDDLRPVDPKAKQKLENTMVALHPSLQ